MTATFTSAGTFAHPNLLASDFQTITEKDTVLSGAGELVAGTVLARDSGNGNKLVPVNDASGTSSITDPHAVLAHDVDATSADAEAIVYIHGHFNGAALTFGGDDTAADHKDALRAKGIFISNNLGA